MIEPLTCNERTPLQTAPDISNPRSLSFFMMLALDLDQVDASPLEPINDMPQQ